MVLAGAQADYAEMFETNDGSLIDVGYFVTFDGASDKLRKATAADNYIIGVVSATPAMVADASDLRWHNLFVTDEWDRVQYHEVVVPETKDEEGNVVSPQFTKKEPILNPAYDPSKQYVSRMERPEWVAVGLVGKLLVRDDGSCQVGGYCSSNDEGIATASENGYRVMKRTGTNQVLVLLNTVPARNELDTVEKLEKLAKLNEQSIEHLKELAKLKEQGFLTDEEFQIQKQKLLSL
jgi:hypothetical protein